jgi:P-type Ca2+ transporter type 2C
MLIAPFLGMPLPLLPLQILWINLVTDGCPAWRWPSSRPSGTRCAARRTIPRRASLGGGLGWHVLWVGLLMGLVSLGLGFWAWSTGQANWQTMLFTTLTLSQMGHALAVRSRRDSLFHRPVVQQAPVGAVLLTFLLQLAVVYLPFLQDLFKTSGAIS